MKTTIPICFLLYVMDSLNKKYEDIRFVWMLHFKGFDVRTSSDWNPFVLRFISNLVVIYSKIFLYLFP